MKTVLSFEFSSPAEATAFLASLGGAAPANFAPPAAPPSAPPAAPPSAPPAAPPSAPPAPPAPPAAPPSAAPSGVVTREQVLAAMSAYAKTHGAPGVKNVLGKCQLTKVTDASQAQLDWLLPAFQSMQAM